MPTWNELYSKSENRWKEIYPPVGEFLDDYVSDKSSLILDLGCGAGRHLKYLADRGYSCTGLDCAENGLAAAREKFLESNFVPLLVRADMTALPYPDQKFDAVISIHVIFHNIKSLVRLTLEEIQRILRPGGYALLTFNSTYSGRYGHGFKIEEGTYAPDIGRDQGIPHHFSDLADLADLLNGFTVQRILLSETKDENYLSSHWNVIVKNEAMHEEF